MITKFTAWRLAAICFGVLLASLSISAQTDPGNNSNEWIRVHSDNGEFSIEVPADYGFFIDDNGFSISSALSDIPLREMRNLNAVRDGTFVSFEIYNAPDNALDRIFDSDKDHARADKVSKIKGPAFELRQIEFKSKGAEWKRRYFRGKKHIYILTAGSREGSSVVMDRFFNSLEFEPGASSNLGKGTSFSKLKVTIPTLEAAGTPDKKFPPVKPSQPDPNKTPVIILSKPQASFVEEARDKRVNGVVRLKVTLAANGSIPKIGIVSSLPHGLLRQAIFAAMRIKFLPQLVNGQPTDVTVTIEYSFSIG